MFRKFLSLRWLCLLTALVWDLIPLVERATAMNAAKQAFSHTFNVLRVQGNALFSHPPARV